MSTYSNNEIADKFGIGESSVRYYKDKYKQFLHLTGVNDFFTDEDIKVLEKILLYKNKGYKPKKIKELLESDDEVKKIYHQKPQNEDNNLIPEQSNAISLNDILQNQTLSINALVEVIGRFVVENEKRNNLLEQQNALLQKELIKSKIEIEELKQAQFLQGEQEEKEEVKTKKSFWRFWKR